MKPLNLPLRQVRRLRAHGLVKMQAELQPGSRYWVREAHAQRGELVYYRADFLPGEEPAGLYWHKSYHLPQALSRFTVVVTGHGRVALGSLRRPFSELERRYLRRFFQAATNLRLGQRLGRPESSIANYAIRNGLRKPAGFNLGRFTAGQVPWNAGLAGWQPLGSQATQFKKGNVPATACKLGDGAITVRRDHGGAAYQWIRLRLGKWQELHRYNWERQHGPVPPGFVLRCRDGNTLNADPANWQLLTRRQNLALNGHGPRAASAKLTDRTVAAYLTKGFPEQREALLGEPALLETKRLQILLQRSTKSHEQQAK